ncbi:cupredoxin family protein [soil metagenome]
MSYVARLSGIVTVAMLLAACSSGASPSPSVTSSEMPSGSGMEVNVGALGEPADASQSDRTVHIVANDQLKFDPDSVDAKVGETITFEIENTGTVDHEFVLGSSEYQADHEEEMQSGGMDMGHEPNELEVAAGETATLTWHFTEAGTTEFGCHEPGHFPAGMLGTINVSE